MTLLTIFARQSQTIALSAALSGSGTLASSPLVAIRPLASGLVGDGFLASSPLVAKRVLTASILGVGSLTPSLVATRPLSTSVAGSGALNSSIGALRLLSIALEGDSAVSASLVAVRPVSAQLAGSGALVAQLSPPSLALALSGSAALDATLVNANEQQTLPTGGGWYDAAASYPRWRYVPDPDWPPPRRKTPKPPAVRALSLSMRGGKRSRVRVMLTVISPELATEKRLPPPDVFPWWEHTTEDEIAMLLLLA